MCRLTQVSLSSDQLIHQTWLIFSSKVVSQPYVANVWEEHVISGNSALMKCALPPFVGDFVTVSAWHQDDILIQKSDVYGMAKII